MAKKGRARQSKKQVEEEKVLNEDEKVKLVADLLNSQPALIDEPDPD